MVRVGVSLGGGVLGIGMVGVILGLSRVLVVLDGVTLGLGVVGLDGVVHNHCGILIGLSWSRLSMALA